MQLRRKLKRLAAIALSLVMALSCMPVGVLAEAATPTDLIPENMATPDEAAPEEHPHEEITEGVPTEAEMEVVPEAPATEEIPSEAAPGGGDDAPLPEEQDASGTPTAPETPNKEESSADSRLPIQAALDEYGHVYVSTVRQTSVYGEADWKPESLVYTTTEDIFLVLATEFQAPASVGVWFLDEAGEVVGGYVHADDLDSSYLLDEDLSEINFLPAGEGMTLLGLMPLFMVSGSAPQADNSQPEAAAPTLPNEAEPTEQPEDTEIVHEQPTPEPEGEPADAEGTGEALTAETAVPVEPAPELPPAPVLAAPGDYISVTTATRVLSEIDEYAAEDTYCDAYLGHFVNNATVQVLSTTTDGQGNGWYEVRFLYGDDFEGGTMKWTDYSTAWVMAAETGGAYADSCTVTDFAYTEEFLRQVQMMETHMATTSMNGFSLKNINGSVGGFYAWQSSLYGSSGRDSAYPQIAKSAAHGSIYATPHYLEGFTVYCLEHNLSGPGEGSGSNQSAKGPYVLVDMDAFVNNPDSGGASGVRYKASTMHALGWVLRHTYPFMAVNRGDSNNEVWSRVAGQFAMREVIKQLEGSQYVRSYWDMDNFYAFSGGAPAVYLTYARWLATNGIARASMTGKITASNQSLSVSGSSYIGTVTLTTDADLIRIPRSVGTLTGNSCGSDGSYYYVRSGDTIRVTSSSNRFAVTMESVSSDDEEAKFLVGVPSVAIQKIMVPIYGAPYALKTASVTFELSTGEIKITKKSSDGILLQGASFELLGNAGSVLATATTGTNGIAVFADLMPGAYTVREKNAPQGYALAASSSQSVTVAAGMTTNVAFVNDRVMGRIRIVKTDKLTGKPLSGAVFSITRLSGPVSDNASDVGKVVATVTTNAQGITETGLLPWGEYKVVETGVPDGYLDSGYATTVWIK